MGVRPVNVGNTGIDLLVVLGSDAERTIGAPHMDLTPRAAHFFVGTEELAPHERDAIVVQECIAEVQVAPILQGFEHFSEQAHADCPPELVNERVVDVLLLQFYNRFGIPVAERNRVGRSGGNAIDGMADAPQRTRVIESSGKFWPFHETPWGEMLKVSLNITPISAR
jgi:hypothetical protein